MKLRSIFIVATLTAFAAFASANESVPDERLRRGEEVIRSLNGGAPQPALEGLRKEFPFLADAIQGYALGEVWARPSLDSATRQLATVSAFAALGNLPEMKIHARYALNVGASEEQLKEIVYLTTVHAGFPRAIAAANALGEVLSERRTSKAEPTQR